TLAWIGPRLGGTGAAADRWIACRPGGELDVALLLLHSIIDRASGITDLSPQAPAARDALAGFDPEAAARRAGVSRDQVAALAAALVARRPSALLGSRSTELAAERRATRAAASAA